MMKVIRCTCSARGSCTCSANEKEDFPNRTHGICATYQAGCRCEPCSTARRTYHRSYLLRRHGVRRVDLQRVRSLGAFLVREHGSIKAAARAAGVSYFALWRVLNDEGCCAVSVASRIVRAVKDIEENWRLEAGRERMRTARAHYRALERCS